MLRDDGVLGQAAHGIHRQGGSVVAVQPRLAVVEGAPQPVQLEEPGAEIVPSAGAVGTRAARHDERADDPCPDRRPGDVLTERRDGAGDLVSKHGGHRERHFTLQNVQVGMAHAAGGDPHEHLTAARLRHRNPLDRERLPGPGQHGCQHRPGKCSHFAHEFAQGTYSPSRKAVNAVGRRGARGSTVDAGPAGVHYC